MKTFILSLVSLLAVAAQAEEAADTTFVVGDRKIVVGTENEKTTVQVYGLYGDKHEKTRELEFVDGQEIERVYVTSPFIPQTFGKRRERPYSHYPALSFGFNVLSGSVLGGGGSDDLHTRDSRSWEWNVSFANVAFSLSKSVVLTLDFTFGQVHNHFQDNYVLTTNDGQTYLRREEDETLRKSYISYTVVRLPVNCEWQRRISRIYVFAGLGLSVEMRWNDHSRYRIAKRKYTETGDINLNPIGLNLEAHAGCGIFMVYGRAALTPLLKTDCAPTCYPVSFGLGIKL